MKEKNINQNHYVVNKCTAIGISWGVDKGTQQRQNKQEIILQILIKIRESPILQEW